MKFLVSFILLLAFARADVWGDGPYASRIVAHCYTEEGIRFLKDTIDKDSGRLSTTVQRDDIDRLCQEVDEGGDCPDFESYTNFFERDRMYGRITPGGASILKVRALSRAIGPIYRLLVDIVGKKLSNILWPVIIENCFGRDRIYDQMSREDKSCLLQTVTSGIMPITYASDIPRHHIYQDGEFDIPSRCWGVRKAACIHRVTSSSVPLENWTLWPYGKNDSLIRMLPRVIYGCTKPPSGAPIFNKNLPDGVEPFFVHRETEDTGDCEELRCLERCANGFSTLESGCKTCFCWGEISCDSSINGAKVDCSLAPKRLRPNTTTVPTTTTTVAVSTTSSKTQTTTVEDYVLVGTDNDRIIPQSSHAVKMNLFHLDYLHEERINQGKEQLIKMIVEQLNDRSPTNVELTGCSFPAKNCYTVERLSGDCLFFLNSDDGSVVKPSYDNLCTDEVCTMQELSGIEANDFQLSDNPDFTVPLLQGGGVRSLKLPFMGENCTAKVKYSVVGIRLTGDCSLDLSIEDEGYVFTLSSVRYSKFYFHITGQDKEEGFLHPGQVKKRYVGDQFTDSIQYEVKCNSKYVNNYIVTDRSSWCERTNDFRVTVLICKNHHFIYALFLAFVALIGIRYIGNLTGDLVAVILTIFSVLSTSVALNLTTSQCENCGCRRVMKGSHKCPKNCTYCGVTLASTEFFNSHLRHCLSYGFLDKLCVSRKWIIWHFSNLLRVMRYLISRASAMIVVTLITFFLINGVEGGTTEKKFSSPISVGINDWGVKQETVPGNLFNLESKAVTLQGVFEACDSSRCVSKGKISMKIKAIQGNGVQLETKINNRKTKVNNPIVVAIEDVYERFETSPLYKACESKVYSGTHFACTGSCDDASERAEKNLCESIGKGSCPAGYSWTRPDSSTIGCEAYTGCIVKDGGCAAMRCLHYAKPETCHSVYSVRQGKYYVKLCIYHMGNYRCKLLEQDLISTSKEISVILTTQDVNLEADTISVDKLNAIYTGSICKRNEYSDKFGQPKFDFNSPGVGDCGQSNSQEANIECHDLSSDIHPSHCCIDTFGYASSLKKMKDWYMCEGSLCIRKRDAGEIEVSMEISGIVTKVTREGRIDTVSNIKVTGCYDCKAGFTVNADATASIAGVYEVKCDKGVNIYPKFLTLSGGQGEFQLVGHKSETKDLDISCSIGNFKFPVKGQLRKENFQLKHEVDQAIKNYQDVSCGFICHMDDWFDMSHWGFAGSIAKVMTLILSVAAVVATVWGIKTAWPGLRSIVGDMNNVRSRFSRGLFEPEIEQRRRLPSLLIKKD